jgi:5'-3' exonuclease
MIPTTNTGYLNNGGVLNLATCELLLARLGFREREEFEREIGDVKWLAAKRDRPVKKQGRRNIELNVQQAGYYARIKEWILSSPGRDALPLLFKVVDMPARDRAMIIKCAADLGLETGYSMSSKGGKQKDQIYIAWPEGEDESDEEGVDARKRVMKRYDAAIVIDEDEVAKALEGDTEALVTTEFGKWKYAYYKVYNVD